MTSAHRHLLELIQRNNPLVNRYRITEKVGAGAYGMIFRATDDLTGENVAVKAISPSVRQRSSTAIARFQRELAVVRNLVHPNIISLYDWGRTEEGLIFMILEFVEGKTLDEVVREQPMSLEDALDTLRQIGSALQMAHAKGVIHRDLKPANVMLSPQRTHGYKVKLLDFGMAKVLEPIEDGESVVDLTREGIAVGTPRYIAPEQARGLPVGPAADLYCTGLLLYEMLTGVQAVQATTVQEAVAAHVSREPLNLGDIDSIPPVIRTLLFRLLEKDPKRRVQSAEELLAAIDEVEARQNSPFIFDTSPQIGPPLGDLTGDFPGAGGREQEFDASDFQPVLGTDFSANKRRSLTQRLFKGSEDLELDYDRFKAFAKPEKDPVMQRRRNYQARWLRFPRTQSEWIEAGLTMILVPFSFLIVGAQAAPLDFTFRVALALAAPLLALLWATVKHSEAWSESFGRLGWASALVAIVIAHIFGPSELAAELTRNPTWFLMPFQDQPAAATVAQFVRWISGVWADVLTTIF